MKLTPFRQEYMKLKSETRKLKGKKFYIPLKLIDNPFYQEDTICTVEDVDISENCVEVIYSAEGENDLWTTISFQTIDDYAEWID